MSALFVTHSKEEGFAFADKIALMKAGKIIQMGKPEQLYNFPESRYVAEFMGKSNYVDVTVNSTEDYQSDFGLLKSNLSIKATAGTSMQLLVRPEKLALHATTDGQAIIQEIEFLGAFQLITVSFKEKAYLVQHNHQQDNYQVGDKVELTIIPHDFVLFD
ncbi:TOBE domain-containing protein [Psychromonas sp. KJ10-10]|uniref:TOBE domain-containing protein n=1 Tax=Psychromonas sp. KJ10-10 TaxID=3391823 RepID=UPI0039B510EE